MSVSLGGAVVSVTNTSTGDNQVTVQFANGTTKSITVQLGGAFPIGTILTSTTTPASSSGWFVCDGQNGTFDLRNRFVYGWGAEAPGATGGAVSATTSSIGTHSHGVSIGGTSLNISHLPSHTHVPLGGYAGYPDNGNITGVRDGRPKGWEYLSNNPTFTPRYPIETSATGGNAAHSHSARLGDAGAHAHTVNIVPRYIRLYYIQRVS